MEPRQDGPSSSGEPLGRKKETEEEESVDSSSPLGDTASKSPGSSETSAAAGGDSSAGLDFLLMKRVVKREPFIKRFDAVTNLPTPVYRFSVPSSGGRKNSGRGAMSPPSKNAGFGAVGASGGSSSSSTATSSDKGEGADDDGDKDEDITGPPPGFQGYLPEGENWRRCPYDPAHIYLRPNVHLPKCRTNYLDKMKLLGGTTDIGVCRYSCGYHFPMSRIAKHEKNCKYRTKTN